MKRRKGIIIAIILVVIVAGVLCGCTSRVFETEYFVCWTAADNEYVTICDFTELAEQQKYLILPKEINGMRVSEVRDRRYIYGSVDMESETLEKVYVNENIGVDADFSKCPNFKKFIYQGNTTWVLPNDVPSYYKASLFFSKNINNEILLPANISFLLNNDTEKIESYYWVDDIEDGEKIEVIPDQPKREGYKFDGWYREPECVNVWDFENDTVTKVEYFIGMKQEDFIETKLYAKWIIK